MPEPAPNNSSYKSERQGIYQGPAELIRAGVNEHDLRSRNRVTESQADMLTRRLGAEGVGWGFDKEPYADTNATNAVGSEVTGAIAKEAHDNAMLAYKYGETVSNGQVVDAYNLSDGTNVSGKVDRGMIREPNKGNILKYPDGAVYRAAEDERKMNTPGGGV